MSIIKVDELSPRSGNDITITSLKTITGLASQFKITGGTAGQALITDGSGGLSFGAVDSLPSQSGQTGKFLKTDGTTATWDSVDEFSVSIAEAAPGSSSAGALWWKSDEGRLKIYYNDGSSSQWVDAFPVAESPPADPAVGGDLTGTASNAQIAANVVGITELNVTDGTSGQSLTTDGSGTLNFADASGGAEYDVASTSTGYFDLPSGTTAQRPGSPATGNLRFNTTDTSLEHYADGNWIGFAGSVPTISSIAPTTAAETGTTIQVTGTNFQAGAVISFIGTNLVSINASSTTVNSAVQITCTTPALLVANEPYDVKITNTNGGSATLADVLDAGGVPAWTTVAGSLGTIADTATGTHFTLAAGDPDSTAVTYTETTSVLTGAGFSLNSATGAITGDPTDIPIGSSTTYSFDVDASDGVNATARTFSITVDGVWTGASGGIEATYSIGSVNYKSHTFTSDGTFNAGSIGGDADVLVVAGGGAGGYDNGGGGGAGGMIEATSVSLPIGTHALVVGAGANIHNGNTGYPGADSTFTLAGAGSALYTAVGGGGGGNDSGTAPDTATSLARRNGGSAGGCGQNDLNYTGNATAGQGNVGGTNTSSNMGGSGGGGAGQAGANNPGTGPSDGGDGNQNNYKDGSAIYYAGGGGGGECQAANCGYGDGGQGGGGHGCGANVNPVAGIANTGGGGGGGGQDNPTHEGAGGGSGIVVIRYIVA